ncbi:MAG: WD40 repeat domain-containing protein [Thermoguttaceae bacterium]
MKRPFAFSICVLCTLTFCLGAEIGTPLDGHRGGVAAVAVSPDGAQVATGGRDKTILVHQTQNAASSPQKLEGHKDAVAALAFSHDGTVLASASGKSVLLWRLSDGKKSQPLEHSGDVVAIAFSPDGTQLITGNKSGGCAVWDVATVKPVMPLAGHAKSVTAIEFINDKYVLTAASEPVIKLCSIDATAPPGAFIPIAGHKDGVASLAVGQGKQRITSGRADVIVSGGNDRAVILWEVRGEGKDRRIEEATRFTVDRGVVTFVAIGPDAGTVVGVAGKTLQQWDAKQQDEKKPKVWTTYDFETPVTAGATDSSRTKFVFLANDGKATLYTANELGLLVADDAQATSTSPLFKLPPLDVKHRWDEATTSGASCVAVSSRGEIGITLDGGRGEIRSVSDTSKTPVVFEHTSPLTSITFTPDAHLVVVGANDGAIRAYDVRTGQQEAKLDKHTKPVRAIAFTPDGQRLVTGSDDNLAHLWDASKARVLGTLAGHTASVRAVAIDPNLTCIVTGSDDKTVRIWSPATFKTVQTLTDHTGGVTAAAFTPDGQRLITASDDKSVIVWKQTAASDDPAKMEWTQERRINDFTGAVTSLAVTPDGASILAGSREGVVVEIGLNDGRLKRAGVVRGLPDPKYATMKVRGTPPPPPPLPVTSVAISPDGKSAVSSGGNATIVWGL